MISRASVAVGFLVTCELHVEFRRHAFLVVRKYMDMANLVVSYADRRTLDLQSVAILGHLVKGVIIHANPAGERMVAKSRWNLCRIEHKDEHSGESAGNYLVRAEQ
jgi:hypothetical protein